MKAIDVLKWPRRKYLRFRGERHVIKRALTYREDGLFTANRLCSFRDDPRFRRAYDAAYAAHSWGGVNIRWRAHIVVTAATHALNFPGDFVECGVNRGGLSMAVCEYLNFGQLDRTFYLMDTFRGIPQKYHRDWHVDYYRECYEEVRERFARFPNVKLIRGEIPGTLDEVKCEKIAFMSIDMNTAVPERAALECFWPRLSHGGIVIMDDYGWTANREQKKSDDEFAKGVGIEIFELPTGQGMLIKP
jgi:O-methyltransferase